MLLPDKHIRISESIVALSGLVLSVLTKPMSFDKLMKIISPTLGGPEWPATHGADSITLALCFLNTIGAVDVDPCGELYRCA